MTQKCLQLKHKYKFRFSVAILTIFLFFSFPPYFNVLLSFLSLGSGEDYRQNPAESNQSTEGELVFFTTW